MPLKAKLTLGCLAGLLASGLAVHGEDTRPSKEVLTPPKPGMPIEKQDFFDGLRIEELHTISAKLGCIERADATPDALPETLTYAFLETHCDHGPVKPGLLHDDENGSAYRYYRIDEDSFSICANFYNSERVATELDQDLELTFNPQTDCLDGKL